MKGECKECFIEFGENIVRNVGKKGKYLVVSKKSSIFVGSKCSCG